MNLHRQRLLVGLVLLVLIIPSIIGLPGAMLTAIFALLCIAAAYEWGDMIYIDSGSKRRSLYILFCVLSSLTVAWFSIAADNKIILYIAVLWWFAALIVSTFYNRALCANIAFKGFLYVHIVIALAACIVAVHLLHQIGKSWLLYAAILVVVSDTSAYYIGRRYGKHKLAPTISAGKTREGLWGALIATLILSLCAAALLLENVTTWHVLSLVLLSLIACIAGVIGDLTESMAKRCAGIKDSGKILPGHGGILDRIDAFIAAAPVIALGILYR